MLRDLDPELSHGSAPFGNLIIEGDNFDALRSLRMTQAGRVKCIYIDPPYNTGNRDFIYKRRFILVSSTEATTEEPDKNLCRDVCAERVRRVMAGYRNRKGGQVPGLGGGFAYLHTRRIPTETVFRAAQHAQLWTALQLIHGETQTPFDPAAAIQVHASGSAKVLYLLRVSEAVVTAEG